MDKYEEIETDYYEGELFPEWMQYGYCSEEAFEHYLKQRWVVARAYQKRNYVRIYDFDLKHGFLTHAQKFPLRKTA